jgi:hypothetical protein
MINDQELGTLQWSIFVAYYVVTSLVLGCGITAVLLVFAVFDDAKHKPLPVHAACPFLMTIVGVLSAITFVVQLVSGPFVFTTDVVCKTCHTRLKVNRIAFFTGKYSRPPRCECGGKIEPALLWKPDVSRLGPSSDEDQV